MKKEQNIIEGIHYRTGAELRLEISGGFLSRVTETDAPHSRGDKRLPVVAPGLVDLQVNGFGGTDLNAPGLSAEQLRRVSRDLLQLGVTTWYPTLITGPPDRITASLRVLGEALEGEGNGSRTVRQESLTEGNGSMTAGNGSMTAGGIHLEGPFISPEDGPRGAHPREYCLLPDLSLLHRWHEASRGRLRLITLAPELPGGMELIRACRALGIEVAIGHTAASGEEIRRAADAGATLSTHLGNGCHAVLPRHPNYIWEQLAEDRLYASMIADGFHLGDAVLKVFFRVKGQRAILVSDSMPYAGMPPGTYDSPAAGRICLTEEGMLHMEGRPGVLAGSAGTLLAGVKKMEGLVGPGDAWDAASVHPARLMDNVRPDGLHEGAPADLVLLDPDRADMRILEVRKSGLPVYSVAE